MGDSSFSPGNFILRPRPLDDPYPQDSHVSSWRTVLEYVSKRRCSRLRPCTDVRRSCRGQSTSRFNGRYSWYTRPRQLVSPRFPSTTQTPLGACSAWTCPAHRTSSAQIAAMRKGFLPVEAHFTSWPRRTAPKWTNRDSEVGPTGVLFNVWQFPTPGFTPQHGEITQINIPAIARGVQPACL